MLLITIIICSAAAAGLLVLGSLTTNDGRNEMLDQYERQLAEVRRIAAEKAEERAEQLAQLEQQQERQRAREARLRARQEADKQVSP